MAKEQSYWDDLYYYQIRLGIGLPKSWLWLSLRFAAMHHPLLWVSEVIGSRASPQISAKNKTPAPRQRYPSPH